MAADLREPLLDPGLVARLLAAPDRDTLAHGLLAAASGFDEVQEVFAYRLEGGRAAPVAMLSSSGLGGAGRRVALWVSDFHARDPVMAPGHVPGRPHGFSRRVSASEIRHPLYREVCFEDPRFVDKLSFGWEDGRTSLVLNFYRGRGSRVRPPRRLLTLANIGLSALATRLDQSAPGGKTGHDVGWIEARLAQRFPALTAREREVCARTVAGWSAKRIAQALGIGHGTVLTYRQRGYARFGFSRAADFLSGLVN